MLTQALTSQLLPKTILQFNIVSFYSLQISMWTVTSMKKKSWQHGKIRSSDSQNKTDHGDPFCTHATLGLIHKQRVGTNLCLSTSCGQARAICIQNTREWGSLDLIYYYVRGNILTLRKQERTRNYCWNYEMCAMPCFVLTAVCVLLNQTHFELALAFCIDSAYCHAHRLLSAVSGRASSVKTPGKWSVQPKVASYY